eukprot:TRINITY_DN7516_c0_g1_i1.p1 TRINITY_DN7516_c0_g1~~TRINITY_DN7516_c0_g1_i1.p1  ORF type:complete len:356 (-),score=38.31 TRINITY_DN7516_c0_g1_i1:53-1060(-)
MFCIDDLPFEILMLVLQEVLCKDNGVHEGVEIISNKKIITNGRTINDEQDDKYQSSHYWVSFNPQRNTLLLVCRKWRDLCFSMCRVLGVHVKSRLKLNQFKRQLDEKEWRGNVSAIINANKESSNDSIWGDYDNDTLVNDSLRALSSKLVVVTICGKVSSRLCGQIAKLISVKEQPLKTTPPTPPFAVLEKISFAGNSLGENANHIWKCLTNNPTITSISLIDNKINDSGLLKLPDLIKSEHCKLKSLDLSGNAITFVGLRNCCSAFSQSTTLRSITLSRNNLSILDVRSDWLSPLLTDSKYPLKLKSLDLRDNNLKDLGAKLNAHLLLSNTSLS